MLDAGAIHPSQSPWCNAVVLVRKEDETLCFCIDFHRLNVCTKKDSCLPQIQEGLESMPDTAHFLTMDFKTGFWQVKMVPESQQYIAFTVGNLGFYEFTHMSLGLCNAPATFQCLMQNTLAVLMMWHTEEEHLEYLCVVFKCFSEFNLKLKPSKCFILPVRDCVLGTPCVLRGDLP